MAFLDQEVSTWAIVEAMSANTFSITQSTGEKVGKLVQTTGSLISGYVIAFMQGWKLTLFISTVIPLILASGYAMNISISMASKKVHEANGNAGKIVKQVISAIKIVVPFFGKKSFRHKYP
ncbi:hypothetical protein L7F22_006457 [Adiantum nelumboides]|nr:hypothetical protein [Adiantum nelumboides]